MRKILLAITSLCVTITAFYCVSSLLVQLRERKNPHPPVTGTYWLPNEENESPQGALAYKFRPNFKGEEWRTEFSINSLGFRGREFKREKAAGSIRILCLGDSCTFGSGGLRDDETYPFFLQNILNDRGNVGKYEVINAGYAGFSVVDGYFLAAQERLLEYKPDIVVICYGWNDHQFDEMEDTRKCALRRFRSAVHKYLPIISLLPKKEREKHAGGRVFRVNKERYQYYLRALIDHFRLKGKRVIVLTAPWEYRLFGPAITKQEFLQHYMYVELTRAVAGNCRCDLLDMFSLFETLKTEDPRYLFNDFVHYNMRGASVVATEIAHCILKGSR